MTSYIHWKKIRLGDVAKVISGFAFKSDDFRNKGTPIIKIKNIRVGTVDLSDVEFVDPRFLSLNDKYHVNGGDILISLTGSHLTQPNSVVGRVAIHHQALGCCLLNQRAGKIIITEPDTCDRLFLFYSLFAEEKRRTIALMASGAASQANISPSQVESVEILFPPLSTQQKIANILSNYDRLIENNTRRIEILEEMARSLYDEWFVKFRFPGYEQTKMVDSGLGLIPEGWQFVNLRKVSSYINRGISPKYDDQSTNIVINQKCIRDLRLNLDLVRRHSKKFSQDKLIQFGDVLVNSTGIGTLGRVAQVYQSIPECTVDSHVSIVRPAKNIDIDYFGCSLFRLQSYFEHSGVGSTGQTELSRESISNAEFLLPSKEIQQAFSQAVSPMRHKIINLFAKNANLRRTRDLLLPRLISGEIDVENLNIDNKQRITEI